MQIISSVSLIDNKIKPFDSEHFSSSGELKSGEAIHKFFENKLGEVVLLHKKVKEIQNYMQSAQSQKKENINRNKTRGGLKK